MRLGLGLSLADAATVLSGAAAPSSLLTSLLSWWPCHEAAGATRLDSTSAHLDLADHGTAGQAAGVLGNAASFNGTTQYLQLASGASLATNGSTTLTFAGFVYFTSLPGGAANAVILNKDDGLTGAGSDYFLGLVGANPGNGPGMIQWQSQRAVGGNLVDLVTADNVGKPLTGRWYFVACWIDSATQTVNLQVNNGPVYSTALTAATNVSSTPFAVGATAAGANSFLAGRVQLLGAWSRLLTAAERSRLANYQPATGNGLVPGTLHSATWAADVPAALAANVNSLSLDGSAGYASLAQAAPVCNTGGGVSLWFKPAAFTGVLLGNSGSANCYVRLTSATNVRVSTDTVSTFLDFTVPTLSAGTWYHLAVTRTSDSKTHVYLSGTESSSGGQTQNAAPLTLDQVGRYWDGASGLFFSGKIAQVYLAQAAWTAPDIASLAAGAAPTTTPFALWTLSEGTGTTAKDAAPVLAGRDYPFPGA